MSSNTRLRITEIFYSLQGESSTSGLPTAFVRLTGCPLRCHYCDTAYAFQGGMWMEPDEIVNKIRGFGAIRVCVTGGEPLAQKNSKSLLTVLCDEGFDVSLETSGAISIAGIDSRVSCVMDLKTPDSGEKDKNIMENLSILTEKDQLKFVICSREDYDWAKAVVAQNNLLGRMEILFSSSFNELPSRQLADWIIEDNLQVRFQMQLHKLLWNDEPGH